MDKIWFTYKSRIRTQQRLQSNDFHSQLLMVWYALLSTFVAVLALKDQKVLGSDTDTISALISIGLLAISLIVTNRDFRGRAIEMRRNYLDLQHLYRKTTATPPLLSTKDIDDQYQKLLDSVENHSEIDDKYFRVFQPGLTSRQPTKFVKVEVYAYILVRTSGLTFLYVAPLFCLALKVFRL